MTKLRQLWLLTAVASVAILAAGYFLMVSPKASKASALRAETQTQEQANSKLRSEIDQLNRQKKDLPKQQAELQKFATKIPDNPALPALIRSLSEAADNSGVELIGLSNGAPQLVASGKPAGRTVQSAKAPAAVQTLTIAQMPITIHVSGKYSQVSQFLSEVENLPRALLVRGFSLTPGDTSPRSKGTGAAGGTYDGKVTLQMTGQLYMTAKVAPAAPAAPKPATTPAAE